MIAGGEHRDVELEEFVDDGGRDAESAGGVFGVGDDQINGALLDERRQVLAHADAPGASEDIADKENAHGGDLKPWMVTRGKTSMVVGRWSMGKESTVDGRRQRQSVVVCRSQFPDELG